MLLLSKKLTDNQPAAALSEEHRPQRIEDQRKEETPDRLQRRAERHQGVAGLAHIGSRGRLGKGRAIVKERQRRQPGQEVRHGVDDNGFEGQAPKSWLCVVHDLLWLCL